MSPSAANCRAQHPELDFGFQIPAGRTAFRTWEVAAIIRHSEDLVINLIEAGEFGPYLDARGPGASKNSYVVSLTGLRAWIAKRVR